MTVNDPSGIASRDRLEEADDHVQHAMQPRMCLHGFQMMLPLSSDLSEATSNLEIAICHAMNSHPFTVMSITCLSSSNWGRSKSKVLRNPSPINLLDSQLSCPHVSNRRHPLSPTLPACTHLSATTPSDTLRHTYP